MHNQESLYDQFSDNEAPVFNTETPHANRKNMSEPYINNNPNARNAARETQKDLSYYAWWRFISHRQPNNEFEQSVNIRFRESNTTVDGKNFDDMRVKYISLYKQMLEAL